VQVASEHQADFLWFPVRNNREARAGHLATPASFAREEIRSDFVFLDGADSSKDFSGTPVIAPFSIFSDVYPRADSATRAQGNRPEPAGRIVSWLCGGMASRLIGGFADFFPRPVK